MQGKYKFRRERLKSPKRLSEVLETVISELGLRKRLEGQKAVLVWNEAMGKRIAEHTKPMWVERGELVVLVDDNIWMNELFFLKKELINKLNKKIGHTVITDIRFKLRR